MNGHLIRSLLARSLKCSVTVSFSSTDPTLTARTGSIIFVYGPLHHYYVFLTDPPAPAGDVVNLPPYPRGKTCGFRIQFVKKKIYAYFLKFSDYEKRDEGNGAGYAEF